MSRSMHSRPGKGAMPGKEKQRSRTGCQTCRSRRVKCDERPGGCRNCERLDLACPLAAAPGPNSTPLAGSPDILRKSRTYRSCASCRASKSRCSGESPACERCRRRGLDCAYSGKLAPGWVRVASSGRSALPNAAPADSDYGAASPEDLGVAGADDDTEASTSPMHIGAFAEILSWLLSVNLPDEERMMRALVEEYFVNIHSQRCLGFIHKPSFMENLDARMRRGLSDDALLHIICAMGAKFFALKHAGEDWLKAGFALTAGSQWARKAQMLLFADLNRVTVEKLMSAVLLYEHEVRTGNYASAFLLSGLCTRMCEALGLENEASRDILSEGPGVPSPTIRESRRRLAWSVWSLDPCTSDDIRIQGASSDDGGGPEIQLPCDERSFVFQIPSITESLTPGTLLHFIPPRTRSAEPCLQAQYLRLAHLRKQVQCYVLHVQRGHKKRLSGHEFDLLESDLAKWHRDLPLSLRLTPTAIYMRKESRQLGGLISLHVAYHQTLCDLCRVCAFDLPDLTRVRALCLENAAAIPPILDEALRHGPDALADPCLAWAAHDSSHILAHYLKAGSGLDLDSESFEQRAVTPILSNLKALERMTNMHSRARSLHDSVEKLLARIQRHNSLSARSIRTATATASSRSRTLDDGSEVGLLRQFIRDLPPTPPALSRLAVSAVESAAPEQAPQSNFMDSAYAAFPPLTDAQGSLPGEGIFQGLKHTASIDHGLDSLASSGYEDMQS